MAVVVQKNVQTAGGNLDFGGVPQVQGVKMLKS